MINRFRSRVYYTDTDAGGVVYYANYLRWMEMARYEQVEQLGLSVSEYQEQGLLFPVARLEVEYLVPAVLGDHIEVQSRVIKVRHVRFQVAHEVFRLSDGEMLARAKVMLACLDSAGRLQPLPDEMADALRAQLACGESTA